MLLKDPRLIESTPINSSWFVDQTYKNIVDIMLDLEASERTVLNIYSELQHKESSISYRDLMTLQDSVFSTSNINSEVRQLHKLASQRKLDEAVNIYQASHTKETLNNLNAAIDNLNKIDAEDDKGYLDEAMNDFEYRMTHDEPVGIKSYKQLDDLLVGGLYGSMLLTIGARPSVGKTAYGVNLAHKIIEQDPEVQVDFFTLEMNKREMLNRFLAKHTKISSSKLKRPAKMLQSYEVMAIQKAMNWYRQRKLRVYDKVTTLNGILSVIRDNASKAKPNKYVAIIDYIGLVKVENSRAQRWEQVSQISRELKIIANEYNFPVVALAQLNRDTQNNKEPQLSNLRDSGSIEQDSNVVAFLYRPDPNVREYVCLTIQKNREGRLGNIDYVFNGEYMDFKEASELDELRR